jgi:hypothetical protein
MDDKPQGIILHKWGKWGCIHLQTVAYIERLFGASHACMHTFNVTYAPNLS